MYQEADTEKTMGNFRSIWKYLFIELLIVAMALTMIGRGQMKNRLYEAEIYGETIASNIELSLNQYVSIVESLGDQYLEYGDEFSEHFPGICSRIMAKDDAIGSMYIAPGGIIRMAYPEEVNASTIGFEPAKDPEQGAATRFAIESKKTTVAGPHALIEGGTGFIVRYPIYADADGEETFVGLAILVMDWDRFIEKVTGGGSDSSFYSYAVWKDNNDGVLTDEDGYIFKSGEVSERLLTVEVQAPNEQWYLTVEETGGWKTFTRMIPWYLGALALILILTVVEISMIRNREVRKQLEYAEAASAAKTAFLFNMSHDIRTPMNSVIGFTKLAMDHAEEPDKVKDYLSKILSSGNHLLTLINDILEMSRIESGKIELNEDKCDLKELTDDIRLMMEEQVKAKNQHFEADNSGLSHPVVICDRLRVNQILLNLLSNAVKFTPEGGHISVSARQLPKEETSEGVRIPCVFRVKDDGLGMSEEFASRIYDAFERENTSTVSGTQGTGLGMAITKRLVDMMDGTIRLRTEQGRGTEFTVTLPLRPAGDPDLSEAGRENSSDVDHGSAPQATASSADEPLLGRHVLLVEDILINRMLAEEVLKSFGLTVDEAENGQEAVDKIRNSPAGTYDAVLMDIQMPVMDGYTATREIRGLNDPEKASIPVIAMTANAFEDDRRNAFEAGMNAHIAKPLEFDALKQELIRWCNK